MRIVKLSVSRISISKKKGVAGGISEKMRLNPVYDPFKDEVDAMDEAATALDTAINAAQKMGPAATQAMYNAATVLDNAIITVATDVDNMTVGMQYENAVQVVVNAGFDVKKKGKIEIPELSVKKGANSSSVKVRRKAVPRGSYKWRITEDITDPTKWVDVCASTYATITINNLKESTKYWVSVAVVFGNTTGDYSTPVAFVTGMVG